MKFRPGKNCRGVSPDQRDDIFRRFWRRRRSGTGAGLGLSIVRNTMDVHGGTVRVEDAEGGGALFILEFPRDRIAKKSLPSQRQRSTA